MEFLNESVLPQSAHHMVLLRFLLGLTFLLFIPYFSVLVGSTILSIMFNKKGRTENNPNYLRFAKDLIDLATGNKSITLGLGIVPILSAIFCYAQLLDNTNSGVPEVLFLCLILFIVSVIFVYTYKYSSHLKDVLNDVNTDNKEAIDYKTKANNLFYASGKYGVLFLLLTGYFLFGAIELANNSARWGSDSSIFNVLFSLNSVVYFLLFFAISIAATCAYLLYNLFKPSSENDQKDSEYLELVKKTILSKGLAFTIIIPITIALNIVVTPSGALSYATLASSVFAILLIIFIASMFYNMLKSSNTKYATSTFFIFGIVFFALITKNQTAFSTTTNEQFLKLAESYEVYETEFKAQHGISDIVISGEDIFNGRCSACHKFDQKLVGPAYVDVLGKYEGKKADLVKFVLNPVKVDPAFPPMPNQGLKPNEADAIADYILKIYADKK